VNADTREPYHRGNGCVDLAINATGRAALGVGFAAIKNVTYADGPMLVPANISRIPDYEVLVRFASIQGDPELHTMMGEPALARTMHGEDAASAAAAAAAARADCC